MRPSRTEGGSAARRRGLALALLWGGLSACGGEDTLDESMTVEWDVRSLVTADELRTIHEQNVDAPVAAGTVSPALIAQIDAIATPGLLCAPPTNLAFDLAGAPDDAVFRLAVGFDRPAFEEGAPAGRVAFRVADQDDRTLYEAERPFGPRVRVRDRSWERVELPLGGLSELRLSTTLLQGQTAPPAAFAGLEVVSLREVPRRRATADAPNLVFVVIDTLRADRLGCAGYPRAISPHLDRLAAEGAHFERAWAASPWTWPSTASLLTTLSPPRHGLTGYEACYLSESLTSLPEVLQREGWTTAAVSTNPLVRVDKGFDQGFESFEEMPWARASEVTARASEWLRENAHRRFALYLHYTDPHEYKPDAAFHEAWVGAPPKGYTIVRARQQLDRFLRGQSHDLDELRADAGHLSELYDATVAEVDAGIGGLLDELAALGLDENTVVVVTSDHGEAFFEHQRLFHSNSLHAEMVHVPLILWGPGVDAGQRVGEPVENRFVANTVLDLLGVRAPADYEGPDLLDVRERATRDGEPLFFTTSLGIWSRRGEHPELVGAKIHGVRTAAELYWFTPDAGRPAEAYFDLRVDPLAQVDVVEDHPRRAAALRDRIEAWLQEESSRCPIVVEGGQSAVELLQAHGYVGDDED